MVYFDTPHNQSTEPYLKQLLKQLKIMLAQLAGPCQLLYAAYTAAVRMIRVSINNIICLLATCIQVYMSKPLLERLVFLKVAYSCSYNQSYGCSKLIYCYILYLFYACNLATQLRILSYNHSCIYSYSQLLRMHGNCATLRYSYSYLASQLAIQLQCYMQLLHTASQYFICDWAWENRSYRHNN